MEFIYTLMPNDLLIIIKIANSFDPRWPNQSCMSLLSSSSIHYWLASNVCKSDTSGSRLKVPFVIKLIKETTITLEYSPYNYNNSRI